MPLFKKNQANDLYRIFSAYNDSTAAQPYLDEMLEITKADPTLLKEVDENGHSLFAQLFELAEKKPIDPEDRLIIILNLIKLIITSDVPLESSQNNNNMLIIYCTLNNTIQKIEPSSLDIELSLNGIQKKINLFQYILSYSAEFDLKQKETAKSISLMLIEMMRSYFFSQDFNSLIMRTRLHTAIESEAIKVVEFFIGAASRLPDNAYATILSQPDEKGDTPIFAALHNPKLDILQCYTQALHEALINEELLQATLYALLTAPNHENKTPLEVAIQTGDPARVNALLDLVFLKNVFRPNQIQTIVEAQTSTKGNYLHEIALLGNENLLKNYLEKLILCFGKQGAFKLLHNQVRGKNDKAFLPYYFESDKNHIVNKCIRLLVEPNYDFNCQLICLLLKITISGPSSRRPLYKDMFAKPTKATETKTFQPTDEHHKSQPIKNHSKTLGFNKC
ncbi:MAG: hypothetical protein P4M14_01190 [Gammaproteobacteria bacterium]|nr:hypothetical protein [Gammaproteobacteria bacterium]